MSSTDNTENTRIVLVVQCAQVTDQVCPGCLCEHAFTARTGGFTRYHGMENIRYNAFSCGGCPGRPVLRKLINYKRNLKKRENLSPDVVTVHLSSCITKSNHHGPRCPHIDYIKRQVGETGFRCVEDSRISAKSEEHRQAGRYS